MLNVENPKYGDLPVDLGEFKIPFNENHFTLYMPIKMAGEGFNGTVATTCRIPRELQVFEPLVNAAIRSVVHSPEKHIKHIIKDAKERAMFFRERYLYLTVKHMLVHPDFWGNRGGEHADGYGTDDINWVWVDKNPTEYCSAEFDIPEGANDKDALNMFRDQWDHKKQVTYPENHLLEITPFVVHRVARVTRYQMRTFVKLSLSKHRFNLIGNRRNYLFDYNWDMFDREPLRNMESHNYSNMDYVPGDVA